MGLCASVLRRRARNRHPEPRRSTPTALFVVRGEGDRRPEPLVLRVRDSGRSQPQKPPAKAAASGRHDDRCRQQGADAPDRMVSCAQAPRLGARSSAGVEPGAPSSTLKTAISRGAPMAPGRYGTLPTAQTTTASPLIVPGTPASAAMTPGRPVWQRRILMGMRCELPRFSGLLLYDEHGRPVHIATPGRRNQRQGKKTASARAPPTAS
ncbi:hypothetical protein D1007_43934 [Hordeum vulgare]|uniref:Uncharacterized protein n=1 Tax=Hordeum vulgare subsp. vulgare TaxID=112509 RepID=A0A8I6YYM9_HORVV|nr:uncharacterized protein LOC123405810 [Hordeum vulgare subsp. vulgare]KAE8782665.1 hypothetical protein D1007_43934 [Hordeum vulgare]